MAPRSGRTSKRSGDGGGDAAPTTPPSTDPHRAPAAQSAEASLPATTGWLLRGKDGRLTAYAATPGGVLRWTETRAGGPAWSGPEPLPLAGLLPYVSVARSAEGFVHLLGVRDRQRPEGDVERDLVHAVQYQTGRPLRDWQSVGNPHGKDRGKGARIGMPSAVLDATGSMHLFVRNANGGLSAKHQSPTGRWQPWGGANATDTTLTGETSAAVTDRGAIDILVPAGGGTVRWLRGTPDAKLERAEEEPAAAVAHATVTAERTGTGALTRFWRDADDSTVRAWRPGTEPASLGGPGTGPLALLRTPVDGYDCTILAGRGPDGRLQVAAYPTEDEKAGLNWTPTGEPCAGAPALALDGTGRVVLACLGLDGALRVTRQKDETGLALEAWRRV
ncbi:hypothetical protein PUR57_11140 [Streptomyces sp. JV176]|uniref:hypothetical protein n=1 Tax=Streptomyces sp. JV176 TaxID=858630 RepID=UPI002E783387|nr:hypothetical protein [Streptomyces sp. JV176]MEE1799221.1 hypothetical protein [Streptomyces sp. JV176]